MGGLFADHGVHILVDGQFGSTGKGVLAGWLALQAADNGVSFPYVVTNAGPNSGHTFYVRGEKYVLKQLPTFAVASHLLGGVNGNCKVILSAGSVINPEILRKEAEQFPNITIMVHRNAAVITPQDIEAEHSGTIAAVAGTASGTGAAIARKVLRDPTAVWDYWAKTEYGAMPPNVYTMNVIPETYVSRCFVEVSQGFSLGINQRFYPKGTSRECTVQQAIADAGIPARHVSEVYMSIRTYPIRVGNFGGHTSGGWYEDQLETDWGSLGLKPELTTVTRRVRRIATFSPSQFLEAARVNDPGWVFLNFLNYPQQTCDPLEFLRKVRLNGVLRPFGIIGGYGPENKDVSILDPSGYPARG